MKFIARTARVCHLHYHKSGRHGHAICPALLAPVCYDTAPGIPQGQLDGERDDYLAGILPVSIRNDDFDPPRTTRRRHGTQTGEAQWRCFSALRCGVELPSISERDGRPLTSTCPAPNRVLQTCPSTSIVIVRASHFKHASSAGSLLLLLLLLLLLMLLLLLLLLYHHCYYYYCYYYY